MTIHPEFMRPILSEPHDDTPRLVYADFLEENGEPERAELYCSWARLVIQ